MRRIRRVQIMMICAINPTLCREMFDCIDLWKFEKRRPTDFFDKFPTDSEISICLCSVVFVR